MGNSTPLRAAGHASEDLSGREMGTVTVNAVALKSEFLYFY